MFDKPTATQTLGLEREGSIFRAAQLSFHRGNAKIERLYELTINADHLVDHVNPLYMSDEGKLLSERLSYHLVTTVLESEEVLVRSLDIKLKKEGDIDNVLMFQAEPLLPYPTEVAILDKIILKPYSEGTLLTLLATRKDYLEKHIAQWEPFQIEPEVISCVPAALATFSKTFCDTTEAHFVVHLGLTCTTCAMVCEGKLLAAQVSQQGFQSMLQAFSQQHQGDIQPDLEFFCSIDFLTLSTQNHPLLFEAFESWRRDITRILYALTKQSRRPEINNILITGEGATLQNLGAALCKQMNGTLLNLSASKNFSYSETQIRRFAIAIGAALSALSKSTDQVNFRQNAFAYPYPWKRLKRSLTLYFGLCFFLAFAIYLFGEAYIGYQEDGIRQEYALLLSSMNKSYPQFEKEFRAKNPSLPILNENIASVKLISSEDIASRLNYLQKDLKDVPNAFPLQPNVPRVSDVLAWLGTHPNIIGKEKEYSKGSTPLQIESFHYTMVKRPEIKKPQEKYQVKIELEFTSPTPKIAREFHDALIAPNDIVDPKGEVKWNSNKGSYRASFFLKDKTIYSGSKDVQ